MCVCLCTYVYAYKYTSGTEFGYIIRIYIYTIISASIGKESQVILAVHGFQRTGRQSSLRFSQRGDAQGHTL